MLRVMALCTMLGFCCGCAAFDANVPQSTAANLGGFTYIPIDPFPVIPSSEAAKSFLKSVSKRAAPGDGAGIEILQYFPDNATRISIESFTADGEISYGVSRASTKGQKYRVTTDFTSTDTTNFRIWIAKLVRSGPAFDDDGQLRYAGGGSPEAVDYELAEGERVVGYRVWSSDPDLRTGNGPPLEPVNIPIYIGIGLRISADIRTLEGGAKIDGLGIIGAEANANKLRGSLVVQTLGVNGKSISAALPVQEELNRTTIQNAVTAVGAIKALLYEDETTIYPRIVGMYLPFKADKALVNAIISEMSANPPTWGAIES